METTKNGNVKIHINPERKYQGQFIGHKYYRLTDVQRAFPFCKDFVSLNADDYDLGMGANNADMIAHHVVAYRKIGHIVE